MALTYTVQEVETISIDGALYRKVGTHSGCDILQRLNHWSWHFVNDYDELSLAYESRFDAETRAALYRSMVDAAGGESEPFTRDVYAAQDGLLRYKGQVIGVSSSLAGGRGVLARIIDPADGSLSDADFVISSLTLLPTDAVGQAVRDTADAALVRWKMANEELEASRAELADLGAQLTAHPSAVVVPEREMIDNVERVRLTGLLDPT